MRTYRFPVDISDPSVDKLYDDLIRAGAPNIFPDDLLIEFFDLSDLGAGPDIYTLYFKTKNDQLMFRLKYGEYL